MAFHYDFSLASPLGPPVREKDAKALQFIEKVTRDADSVQQKVLAEILSQNAETEYLKRFQLDGATDRDTFKCKVPVVTYEDLRSDIQRIANGDRSPIFSSRPISELISSSGTSAGESKLLPAIHEDMDRRHLFFSLLVPLMNRFVPDLDKGKSLFFFFIMADMKTPGGLVARPVSTSYFTSDQFLKKPFDPCSVYTCPKQAILCTDSFQSMYSQMLCGLIMRHQVLRVGTLFASSLVRAIRFLQHNYQQLAHDISIGTLSPEITHPSIKQCVAQILKPDPELADFITQQCSTQNWERIITRIWPNTKYIDVTVTGSMAQYIPTLDYYTGGLPLVSTIYCSSECFFGLNLNPFCNPSDVSYTILPNMGYFEFLPLDDDVDDKTVSTDLVDLAHVEIGKCYELVVTTYAGLYRYRVGDILRVTGFYNSAPQFGFVRRKNAVLSIDMEKTDEEDLQRAVENASMILKEFNTSVVEYTSFADVKSIPGHYVIYWELWVKEPSNRRPTSEALNRCCLAMEESLNVVYRHMRVVDKCIGALEIRVVKNGTFEKLMDYAISKGASISQYKVPRCVSLAPIIELLDSRVVSVHFSPDALHGGTPEQRRIE